MAGGEIAQAVQGVGPDEVDAASFAGSQACRLPLITDSASSMRALGERHVLSRAEIVLRENVIIASVPLTPGQLLSFRLV